MSMRRRMRRQAPIAEFTPLLKSPAAAVHGCEVCRGDEKRRGLAQSLVSGGKLCAVKAQCVDCGAFWIVELFAEGPARDLRISFQPVKREKPN